ncbi:MAG TPA: rRNA maturation RNase YbeY [Candidatus Dormibacteraeota bacterium]|nr:rRNA maturation RNase YbeY [Candidatus Dormibacteraeota bacterium]
MTLLDVEVVKEVSAPVRIAFVREVLERAAQVPEVAARLPEGEATVALRITDDKEMELLNRTYADMSNATDLLSFEGVKPHVGDIAISWQAVERQAARYGHEPRTELALLVVHGFLHLLGWDHRTAPERREMTRLTVAALALSRITPAPRRL